MVSSPDALVEVESASIRTTRLETIRVTSILVVLVLAGVGLRARHDNSLLSDALLGGSVLAALAGSLPRQPRPWLSLAGMGGAALATSLVLDSEWRSDSLTTVFLLAYFGVVLLPRRIALVWLFVPVVLWSAVAPASTIPVDMAGWSVNLRWLTLLQLVVSGLLLWWIWERELDAAAARDAATIERERDRLDALQVQERVRVWRRMLVHTHETVLNDIRYVLASTEPDAGRLAEQLRTRELLMSPAVPRPTVSTITGRVAAAEGLDKLDVVGGNAVLDRRQAEVLTSVFREVVRNAQRHSSASVLHLIAHDEPGGVRVQVRHDREQPIGPVTPGIGQALVIEDSLESIGGSSTMVPHGIDLWIPHTPVDQSDIDPSVSDVGRLVLAAVLVGNALGGLLFSVAIAVHDAGPGGIGALVASSVAASVGAIAWRRRSISVPWALVATVAASLATWLSFRVAVGCSWSEVAVIIATLNGFALCSSLMWAHRWRWWSLGVGWVTAMVWVFESRPEDCVGSTAASFRAATLPIAFFVAITWSLRRSSLAAQRRKAIERGRIAELAAAAAAVTASQGLQTAMEEATSIMRRVADGNPLDAVNRARLGCLDATIRAAVQVDPGLAGGVALAAQELVTTASALGVPARVLTLRDSGDRRPVPPTLTDAVRAFLPRSGEGPLTIQVLTGPDEDLLVVTTPGVAAQRAAATGRFDLRDGPDSVSYDAADSEDMAVVFLRRSHD